jgi:MFS-type transporter involved in bile tolerance (Atg22 family)
MPKTPSIVALVAMLGGMIVWAILFTLFYGGASLICTPPVSMTAMSVFRFAAGAIGAASLFALIAGAVLLWRGKATAAFHSSPLQTFMINSTMALAIAGLIAAVWLAVPVLIFSDCRS